MHQSKSGGNAYPGQQAEATASESVPGPELEREKAAEGVTGIGLPEEEIVSDYTPGGPIKKQSATPNPAVSAKEAISNKSPSPEQQANLGQDADAS